jgi:hypothetical protein
MSKTGELVYAIQEDLDAGILSFASIAEKHGIPVQWVEVVNEEYVEQTEDDWCPPASWVHS